MCDQANHDNCEVVDELYLEISDLSTTNMDLGVYIKTLESNIADLKLEIEEDLKHIKIPVENAYEYHNSDLLRIIEKWEAK